MTSVHLATPDAHHPRSARVIQQQPLQVTPDQAGATRQQRHSFVCVHEASIQSPKRRRWSRHRIGSDLVVQDRLVTWLMLDEPARLLLLR